MKTHTKFFMPGEAPEQQESMRFFIGLRMPKSMFLDLEKEAKDLQITLSELIRNKIGEQNDKAMDGSKYRNCI